MGWGTGSGTQKFVHQKWHSHFPNGRFRSFPRWSLWSGGGGGVQGGPPSIVQGHSNTSLATAPALYMPPLTVVHQTAKIWASLLLQQRFDGVASRANPATLRFGDERAGLALE